MSVRLLHLGLTRETAPLSLRERFCPDDDARRVILARLADLADGRWLLTTCERFELYASAPCSDVETWLRLLAGWFHVPVDHLAGRARVLRGKAAVRHLLRVAAGLESRIVGETHILGQVREAYRSAMEEKSLDAALAALGRSALRTGKRVRHETRLGTASPTLARRVAGFLRNRLERHRKPVILIVGSGRVAEDLLIEQTRSSTSSFAARDVARAQARRSAQGSIQSAGQDPVRERARPASVPSNRWADVRLIARNEHRAAHLSRAYGVPVVPWNRLAESVAGVDAVVVCTSARRYVLEAGMLRGRGDRPVKVLDLAVPRNVDPRAAALPGVTLWHLEDIVDAEPVAASGLRDAERIVEEEVETFMRWLAERRAGERIASLIDASRRAGAGCPLPSHELHSRIMRIKREVVT